MIIFFLFIVIDTFIIINIFVKSYSDRFNSLFLAHHCHVTEDASFYNLYGSGYISVLNCVDTK